MNQQATDRSTIITGERLAGLLEGWADGAHGNLAQRLAHALRSAVQSGILADGSRLPSERALGQLLAVSRSTVTAALDELRSEGVLVSRQGAGTTVRSPQVRPVAGTRVAEHFSAHAGIDLAVGNPSDVSHLPPLRIDVSDLLAVGGGPGREPLGLASLRTALAARHERRGRVTEPSQIHVTSGAHHAIALCVIAATGNGAPVAVEQTSYPGIFDILDAVGAHPVPVRCDSAGLVPEELHRLLARVSPPVLYCQTGPHNPTGTLPTPGRLRALAEVLDGHDTLVIEDCTLADLAFGGRSGPELGDLCRKATVISVGSFSKVAWDGLRLGWLRAPEHFVERTLHLRLGSDMGTSIPSQILGLELLPHLDDLAARRRATLQRTVERAVAQLRLDLPDWTVAEPAGGSVLWVELPVDDTNAYVQLARRHGVHIAPGSIALPNRSPDPHVRICVDRPWPAIEEGIRRLAQAWREHDVRPLTVPG